MNILVTGASGFVGKGLLPLLARDNRIFAAMREQPTTNTPAEWVRVDLSDPNFTQVLPRNIDVVVALAQSRHYRDFPDKAKDIYSVNIQSMFQLLEWCRHTRVRRIIYTSSANVYAQTVERITELSTVQPTSFYAQSKRTGEMLVESYSSFMECIVLRVFTVYGPEQKSTLIPQITQRIMTGHEVDITGKEGLRISPIFITDLCRVLATAANSPFQAPSCSVLNVAGDEVVSIRDIAESLGRIAFLTPHYRYHPGSDSFGWAGDNTKLKQRYSLDRFLSVEQGLRKIIHEYSRNAA